jgi:hypothetical protein
MESFRKSPGRPGEWTSEHSARSERNLSHQDHAGSYRKERGINKITYLSHFAPGALFDRMHLAFAVEHCAQAAPHLAVAGFGLWPSVLDIIIDPDKICNCIKSVQEK